MRRTALMSAALLPTIGILLVLDAVHLHGADALAGIVSSQAEGRMEGVLVTAKRVGSTVAVTVVSDSGGRYSFPSARLQPGTYNIKIRAVGYELDEPRSVNVQVDRAVQLDLSLVKTTDLAAQLTNAEWLMSMPGTEDQKRFRALCVNCHSMERVFRSTYDASSFLPVLQRMGINTAEAGPEETARTGTMYDPFADAPDAKEMAKYLSAVNLSTSKNGKWAYELKTLPRPTGRGTKAIVTEYDLPRSDAQPHDVMADGDGMIWYADFGNNPKAYLGRLNPNTGAVKEWEIPLLKPRAATSVLDLRLDQDGNPWLALRAQGGVAKFDKKSETFRTWAAPPKYNFDSMNVSMIALNPDGTVWFKDGRNLNVHRLDPKTERIDTFSMPHDFYGIASDSKGNLYLASLNRNKIGMMDAKTGQWEVFSPPTLGAAPRRGHMDREDRFWFGEYLAGKIGMFDPRTKEIKEWAVAPVPLSGPYDVVPDRNGDIWAGGEFTDFVYRLNPANGNVTTYLLPTLDINIRRVSVDDSTTPVTFWIGENHQAKIAKLEPLD